MSVAEVAPPTHPRQELFYIGGQWVEPRGGSRRDVICPATEEVVANVPLCGVEEADLALAAARKAFDEGPWPRMTVMERAAALGALLDALERRIEDSGAALTWETGAPISGARFGNKLAVDIGRDFVELAPTLSFSEDRPAPGGIARVLREPAGVAVGLIPWNGPHPLMMSKLGPALIAGCTVILKPAPEAPFQAMYMAQAAEEAGLPPGVLNVLTGGPDVGDRLVRSPLVDKIAFTGGGNAGREILIAAATNFSRVTLELGGKSAAIVLDDAPTEGILRTLVPAGVANAGQVCRALTRVIVSSRRHDEFVEELAEGLRNVPFGDPFDTRNIVGPVISAAARERIEGRIADGIAEGARLVVGGGRPPEHERGYYVQPTLFDRVDPSMRLAQEEVFGPVVSVISYGDIDEAVDIANDSDYGLSGIVYTKDHEQGFDIARRVRTGSFNVDSLGVSIRHPFGGYKKSGFGREGGPEGLEEYLEVKQVFMPQPVAG